jgi:hypothetical protein
MPEAGSVIIKLPIRNRPRVSCCQSVTQPGTTFESCREDDTRLNLVKNRSLLRLGTFNPVAFPDETGLEDLANALRRFS